MVYYIKLKGCSQRMKEKLYNLTARFLTSPFLRPKIFTIMIHSNTRIPYSSNIRWYMPYLYMVYYCMTGRAIWGNILFESDGIGATERRDDISLQCFIRGGEPWDIPPPLTGHVLYIQHMTSSCIYLLVSKMKPQCF